MLDRVHLRGHTHEAALRRIGGCTLLIPGEVMGRKRPVGYALLDTGEFQESGGEEGVTLHTL